MRVARRSVLQLLGGGGALLASACSGGGPPPPSPAPTRVNALAAVATRATALRDRPTLTVYVGRTKELVEPLLNDFARLNDVKIDARFADSGELAQLLVREAGGSPADLFLAQDAGPLGMVAGAHLLAPLSNQQLRRVDQRYRSARGEWLGLSGRARVILYNTQRLRESQLPDRVEGLLDPRWQGQVGWAPTNSSFQAFVTAMRLLDGDEAARRWLTQAKANGFKSYANNTQIVEAVDRGELAAGLVNHYYLYSVQAERGRQIDAAIYSPREGGAGALVNVSGAGILKTSRHREVADQLMDFFQSPQALYYFISRTFELNLAAGGDTSRLPFNSLDIRVPSIDLDRLAETSPTVTLLRSTGVLA